jgi:hypothetical protein
VTLHKDPQPWQVSPLMQARAQLCVRAADLRARGWSYRDIAAEIGAATARDAQKAAEMGASFAPPDNVRTIRKLAEDMIMRGVRAAGDLIDDPGPLVAPGIGIVRDDDGNPLPDKTVISQGVARLYDGAKMLAALHGANAPRQSVSLVTTMSAAEIRAVRDQVMEQAREIGRGTQQVIPGTAEDPDGDVP